MNVRGVGESAGTGSASLLWGDPVRRDDDGRQRGGHPEGLPVRPVDLSDYREVLDFESSLKGGATARARAIHRRFGVSVTTYLQALHRAIDHPEALAHAPSLVARLRRIRTHRRAVRSAGRVVPIRPNTRRDYRQLTLGEIS